LAQPSPPSPTVSDECCVILMDGYCVCEVSNAQHGPLPDNDAEP
jgi:hypothetical protein